MRLTPLSALAAALLLVPRASRPQGAYAMPVFNASLLGLQLRNSASDAATSLHEDGQQDGAQNREWIYNPFSHPSPTDPGPTASGSSPSSATSSSSTAAVPAASSTSSLPPDPKLDGDVIASLQVAVFQADKQVAAFQHALQTISAADWTGAGLDDKSLLLFEWMAQTSQSHRSLLAAQLVNHGEQVPLVCTYDFRWRGVAGFLDSMSESLQDGLSGLVGTVGTSTTTDVATIVTMVAAGTSGMIQLIRQLRGLWPNPVTVPPALPIEYFWTRAAQSITSCPDDSPMPKVSTIYPTLSVTNMPTYPEALPALISPSQASLTEPNKSLIELSWKPPGEHVGPFNQTSETTVESPTHALLLAESLVLAVPLVSVNTTSQVATFVQPLALQVNDTQYGQLDTAVNGTVYIALIDGDDKGDQYSLSLSNLTAAGSTHTFAGPVAYRAG